MRKAYLVLQNGEIFEGLMFGKEVEAVGEIVFATGMTGYIETLTDPSYYGQIVLQTFPLIGNYGVIPEDFESESTGLKAYIVKHPCASPSNFRSVETLDALLKKKGIPGFCNIDTRKLTKIIRESGVMNGKIMLNLPSDADAFEINTYVIRGGVANSSTKTIKESGTGDRRIALMDFGAKAGIANALIARGCKVFTFPYNSTAEDVLKIKPHGVMLSNGPGDPADPANKPIVDAVRTLMASGVPVFGICLGHQLMALAQGYHTKKLKFGHRGANQPVKELATGRVYITSQNHGYAVTGTDGAFMNVNDLTNEGMEYGTCFSVQFHPEAKGGPLDTSFLFDRFIQRTDKYASK